MSSRTRAGLVLLVACMALGASARAQENPPDDYLCYSAGSAYSKKRPPIGKARPEIQDRLGGPQTFAVRRLAALCNPAAVDGDAISHSNVHLVGLTIKNVKGAPKFVPTTQSVADRFGVHTLEVTNFVSLLDVSPVQPGTTAPADFSDDPTKSATEINRFKCYEAALPKEAAKLFSVQPPIVTDEVFPGGQQFLVKKVTKLCLPADVGGATPGAEARSTLLVCYGVKLPKGAKFTRQIVGTRSRTAGVRIVGRRKPVELCVVGRVFPGD